MSPSALTSENSAIVMIDHAAGSGNVFRCVVARTHATRQHAQQQEVPVCQPASHLTKRPARPPVHSLTMEGR